MGLRSYVVKRIIYSFILVSAVIIFDYLLFMQMGNPLQLFLPPRAGVPADVYKAFTDALLKRWGLDQPLHIQLFKALSNMLTFNFGVSYRTQRDIPTEITARMPYTILLVGFSTALSIIIGIILGVLAAHKRGTTFDSFSVTSSLVFYSLPVFWMGMLFLLVFASMLRWLPSGGAVPDMWATAGWPVSNQISQITTTSSMTTYLFINGNGLFTLISGYAAHLFLPLLTLTLFQYGGYLLLTRATMMDALTEDYIVTARAKGLTERVILLKHALKNASLPLITSAALSFAFTISGAIITETVFRYPGMGGWIWYSISFFDYGVLMPIFYIMALCVIIGNLIADLLYGVIDPRIKYG